MKILFLILATALFTITSSTQDKAQGVLYLKNGSIIKGTIIEMIPNQSIKIKTSDENILVFRMEEVEKVLNSLEEKAKGCKEGGYEEKDDFDIKNQIYEISYGTSPYVSGEFFLSELMYYDFYSYWEKYSIKISTKIGSISIYIPQLQTNNVNFGLSISYMNGQYKNSETDTGRYSSKINNEFKVSGIQIDGDIKFISTFNQIAPFCGFGISYINSTGSNTRKRDYNDPYSQDRSTKYDVTMYGFAQYFEVGSYFKLNSKLSAVLELKKMGISFIKIKYESDARKIEEDLVSKQGLDDVGISLGIRFGL